MSSTFNQHGTALDGICERFGLSDYSLSTSGNHLNSNNSANGLVLQNECVPPSSHRVSRLEPTANGLMVGGVYGQPGPNHIVISEQMDRLNTDIKRAEIPNCDAQREQFSWNIVTLWYEDSWWNAVFEHNSIWEDSQSNLVFLVLPVEIETTECKPKSADPQTHRRWPIKSTHQTLHSASTVARRSFYRSAA